MPCRIPCTAAPHPIPPRPALPHALPCRTAYPAAPNALPCYAPYLAAPPAVPPAAHPKTPLWRGVCFTYPFGVNAVLRWSVLRWVTERSDCLPQGFSPYGIARLIRRLLMPRWAACALPRAMRETKLGRLDSGKHPAGVPNFIITLLTERGAHKPRCAAAAAFSRHASNPLLTGAGGALKCSAVL